MDRDVHIRIVCSIFSCKEQVCSSAVQCSLTNLGSDSGSAGISGLKGPDREAVYHEESRN